MRAKRAQEQAEREWRAKEASEARKKAETEAMLVHARQQQMMHKEHYLAVQAQRERQEFERVLRWVRWLCVCERERELKLILRWVRWLCVCVRERENSNSS